MEAIVEVRGRHRHFIRCDNGPEFTANALRAGVASAAWHRLHRARIALAEPWVESYGSRIRDELLAIEQFDTLLEAQVLIDDWRSEYND